MKNRRLYALASCLLASGLLVLSACKLQIKVPQGGTVTSSDGAYTCEAGQTCTIDVVDLFFDETFVAEAAPGYYFSRWNKLDGYLCGAETTPCQLSTAAFEGHPALEAMLESNETFALQPVFVKILDCPEPELIISPGPLGR